MKQIIQEVITKINWSHTLKSITDKGLEKLAISAIGATIWDIAFILMVLVFLSIMDIITRLVACSYHLWVRTYGEEFTQKNANFYLLMLWIPSAHKWRFVNSMALRTGFVSKFLTYTLLIIAASACDAVLPIRAMLSLITSILSLTEMLSICENLSESNISVAKEIRELVSRKKEQVK